MADDLKEQALQKYKGVQKELEGLQKKVKELKKEAAPLRKWLESMGALEPVKRNRKKA